MSIAEQAAYLKGLAEGMGMDPGSRDGKLWTALTALLTDVAHELQELQQSDLDLSEALDDLGEELVRLEEIALDLDDPEDFEDFEDFEDLEDPAEDEDDDDEEDELYSPVLPVFGGEDEEEVYEGVLYDVTCPSCGKEISFDESTLDEGAITCPGCGELLEFDLGEGEDE